MSTPPPRAAAGDAIPPKCRRPIEVRVGELRQLFNAIDPSPFLERDLDPEAEEFIVDWSRDLPTNAVLALVVHLERAAGPPEEAALLRDAVHEFFRLRAVGAPSFARAVPARPHQPRDRAWIPRRVDCRRRRRIRVVAVRLAGGDRGRDTRRPGSGTAGAVSLTPPVDGGVRENLRMASPVARLLPTLAVMAVMVAAGATTWAWGPQGHRLVGLVAARHLTPAARQAVTTLLDGASLADVSVWADRYLEGNNQTSFWHYVNIPPDAGAYDRDRDCPTQPGVRAGGRLDRWRDCVVDRIEYHAERLGNSSLDRADRAIALKFLVHLVGDLHQPWHALGVERGGNGIPVAVFGSPTCRYDDGTEYACNMHGTWDTVLVARRGLDDPRYLAELERLIADGGWAASDPGSPAQWAIESHGLAKAALLPANGAVDEAYYRTHIGTVDRRLALGGLRLAALINRRLGDAGPPPR